MKAALLLCCLLSGCAFSLGNVQPQPNKTQAEEDLAELTCKDRAKTSASDGTHVTEEAALGATIVGLPAAIAIDHSAQRKVFAECMAARGFTVTPP